MSKVNDPDDESDRTPNVVHLRGLHRQQGLVVVSGTAVRLPNPIRGKSRTRETVGNISPQPQLFQNWFGFAEDGGPKLVDISAEDISRHVLLTQLGRKVADIVTSESAVARRTDLPANHEVNVLTRAQAIPIIAHYLRTQQIYLMHPIYNKLAANRQVWYHSAVYTMAPRISYWDLLLVPKQCLCGASGRAGSATAELLAERIDEEAAGGHWPERTGCLGQCVAGIGLELDVGCGDVELELLDAGRSGNGNHARQADQPGQRHLCRLGVDLSGDVAQHLQQRLDTAQVLRAEKWVHRPDTAGPVVEVVLAAQQSLCQWAVGDHDAVLTLGEGDEIVERLGVGKREIAPGC